MKFKIEISADTEEQAQMIEHALNDRVFRATASIVGFLSKLPSARARERVILKVTRAITDEQARPPVEETHDECVERLRAAFIRRECAHGALLSWCERCIDVVTAIQKARTAGLLHDTDFPS